MVQTGDYICIEGLRVAGRHGVADAEREVEQEFEIWVKMEVDTRQAAQSDNLDDALNYIPVRDTIVEILQNRSFCLIERLADTLCNEILKDKKIRTIELTIKKVSLWSNGVPGITIIRTNKTLLPVCTNQ